MGNPGVDEFIQQQQRWGEALAILRGIVLSCSLDEALKWGQPCYSLDGSNLIILGSYRDACVMSFLKGSQLSDPEAWLEKPGPNTVHGRVIRFTEADVIRHRANRLRGYVMETIECHRSGKVLVRHEADVHIPFPDELLLRFREDTAYQKAFLSLTQGRQRAYLMHFTASSTVSTRLARIERYRQRILDGKGMQDCHCGLSKRMPRCDGSHGKKK